METLVLSMDKNQGFFPMNEEECWQAILARAEHSAFFYAVRSTGIYCRPDCPSRKPRREHVEFFPSSADAEQAGYRPCQRCQPQNDGERSQQAELAEQVCQAIQKHIDETGPTGKSLTLPALGMLFHRSPSHLQRTFKRIMGVTPHQYAEAYRLQRFKIYVKEKNMTVTDALYEAGYSSSSRLYEKASERMGMTPEDYRRGGAKNTRALEITYTIVDSPLSRLLVAATDRGVCTVSMGDTDEMLETHLYDEYPAAQITRDDVSLQPWIGSLLNYLTGQQPHLDLPLDVQATAFQAQVWHALREIPYGETRSYSAVAQMIGKPTATRAVARACATNPVALIIPCHRVLREDGKLGGYRWGLERKQALLDQEQIASQNSSTE